MATNKRVANRQHRWLSSVEITGVVLSEPVLADAGNFRSLDKKEIAEFRKQREIWNLPKGMVEGDGQPAWLNFILEDFLGLKDKDYWQVGAAIPANMVVNLSEHQEVLRPNRILIDDGQPVMLVLEVPREQSLDRTWLQAQGRWKASPTTKLDRLLRETKVELGLLTNGEAWRLVVASPSETTSWLTWTAHTWNDDILTLAAFKNLLGETRFFAGPREEVILELIKQSRERQLDVADQLGNQVREALQLLVHDLDRVDADLDGEYLKDYTESEIFESTVAFIMRLIFTLYAEENGLLPHGNVAYDRAYGVLHLLTELEETKRLSPDKLKHSYSAYARLLASTQLLHDGSIDPDIRIAAHGGQLFDPNRYPLLDGRTKAGVWATEEPEPPKVRDSVVRDVLRSLKYAKAEGVRQIVSYRTLAVEQIGHMYEGLLDRRAARAPSHEALLLLQGGPTIKEPDPIAARTFSGLDQVVLIKAIAKLTSKTANTIRTVLEREENRHNLPDLGTDDVELLEIATPVIRFIKKLGIVRPGGLYITQGQDRRSSGAHYTPPTLTEPVVRRTLEHQVYVNVKGKPGLLVEPKLIKSPEEILSLKVCDPAMGSGAFLVQATRYLANRLVDAWESVSTKQPDDVLTMPFAQPSKGNASENLMPDSREERIVFARRYVAERCIYGVDMNRLAVEMAKLSLWLTTLSNDRPFTFVDHALKHGNSLVGLTPKQIEEFTWKSMDGEFGPLFTSKSNSDVKEVEQHREEIHNIPDHDFIGKEKENRIAEKSIETIRRKATVAIAAFFNGAKQTERESNLVSYRYWLERIDKDNKAKAEILKIVYDLTSGDNPVIPFCWGIEFPEVFSRRASGFDAIVGNPPFLGGKRISTELGKPFAVWSSGYSGMNGNADLAARFFRRAFDLINSKGSIGFVSTNSISQGDTRRGGLRYICNNGGTIYHADKRVKWPGQAAVIVSIVCISKKELVVKYLDDKRVKNITAFLFHQGSSDDPYKLAQNADLGFVGCDIKGQGFLFDDNDELASPRKLADELITNNPKNKECIYDYMSGEEINDSYNHKPIRKIIFFGDKSLEEARLWPDLIDIVEKKVKSERQSKSKDLANWDWWRFWRNRNKLRSKISNLEKVIAISRVSQWGAMAMVSPKPIYSEAVVIIALEDTASFAILQSNIHGIWSRFFSSSMKDDLRYSVEDCLETFPFPDKWQQNKLLKDIGEKFLIARQSYMQEISCGLTQFYNRINSPEENSKKISALRSLIQEIDTAVIQSYGWDDIQLSYDFIEEYKVQNGKKKAWRYRWPDDIRDEVLGRLLFRNSQLYKDQLEAKM
ncbi:DNA methyltransferase [Desulforhopalus sp. IMCC35007]|uniref:DNA methyltransferase n=1 Tax=Desulforhopalus sp. IMCC35007 TaxID=2569543 RepID=UPI0010ADD7E7|nr:DNA methyltransferase [Desulforhopalus sp. IMCC35007]TKB08841.1 class I SAM-dependent DNA methyltransferase [Desulforhopalus sp. IMCC35007]